jgi:hypothetical protein
VTAADVDLERRSGFSAQIDLAQLFGDSHHARAQAVVIAVDDEEAEEVRDPGRPCVFERELIADDAIPTFCLASPMNDS